MVMHGGLIAWASTRMCVRLNLPLHTRHTQGMDYSELIARNPLGFISN